MRLAVPPHFEQCRRVHPVLDSDLNSGVMTYDLIYCGGRASINRAVNTMERYHIKPILNCARIQLGCKPKAISYIEQHSTPLEAKVSWWSICLLRLKYQLLSLAVAAVALIFPFSSLTIKSTMSFSSAIPAHPFFLKPTTSISVPRRYGVSMGWKRRSRSKGARLET